MKKTTLFLVILFAASSAFAQLDLKLNAWGLANKKIEIGVEAGSDKFGLELMAGYSFKPWGDGIEINNEKIAVPRSGVHLGLRGNYYFNPKESLDGWYVSPYTYYRNETVKFTAPEKHNRLSAGLILGRKGMIYGPFGYLAEGGGGYNIIYNYKDKATGKLTDSEESIPIIGGLITKVDIVIRASVFYRIGGQ